jgi:hypothetical protein
VKKENKMDFNALKADMNERFAKTAEALKK